MEDIMEEEVKVKRGMVGPQDHVICALSRGVDLTVAATVIDIKQLDRLHCDFVDNGLIRYTQQERVTETFERDLHLLVTCVDASVQFLSELKAVADPDKKTKVIRKKFIAIFDAFANGLQKNMDGNLLILVQGTLYPDVVESCPPPGSGRTHSHTIKSHHNVGGLPKDMKLIIEPFNFR